MGIIHIHFIIYFLECMSLIIFSLIPKIAGSFPESFYKDVIAAKIGPALDMIGINLGIESDQIEKLRGKNFITYIKPWSVDPLDCRLKGEGHFGCWCGFHQLISFRDAIA